LESDWIGSKLPAAAAGAPSATLLPRSTSRRRPSLRRPLCSSSGAGARHVCRAHLSLAELDGCLAAVHHDYPAGCIDMWLLVDLEQGRSTVRTLPSSPTPMPI